jgi:hypothetical protein
LLESILGLREGIITSNTYGLSVDDLLLLMREKNLSFFPEKYYFIRMAA